MSKINQAALKRCIEIAHKAGSPKDQVRRFLEAGYIPLPWQWHFHSDARLADKQDGPVDIGLGGARGPGKSHAVLSQAAMDDCQRVDYLKGLFLRQTGIAAKESFDDLVDKVIVGHIKFKRTGSLLQFPNGSRILLGGFKDEKEIDKYIGIEYDFIIVEELNQLTKDKYDKLRGSLRTSKPDWRPRLYTSFNPGGIGHGFVKARYIIPFNERQETETRFIGSNYKSNPHLNKEYIDYLESLEGDLGRAWREGDWDLFAGQVFHEWRRNTHVIKPVIPRGDFQDVLWLDWGYAKTSAFAATLNSIANLSTDDGQKYNQIITYKEWYGNQQSPREWARKIYDDCLKMGKHPRRGKSDPAMHSPLQSGGNSIANTMMDEWKKLNKGESWCTIERGSNSGRNSRVNRVGMMHEWFSINPVTGLPYWVATESCNNFNRSIPELVHDENLVEAYDTTGDDHMADQASYGLESVRFISVKPGSYSALTKRKKKQLPTDEHGLPVLNSRTFFGSVE